MKSWTDEQRQEYYGITNDAHATGETSAQRIDLWLDGVEAALGAGALWARDLEREAWRLVAAKHLRKYATERRAKVTVTHDGQVISRPRSAGVKTLTSSGREAVVQMLFDFMTWEQIKSKVADYAKQVDAYKGNILVAVRLLELESAAPGAATVEEALERLGLSMQDWLDGAVAA